MASIQPIIPRAQQQHLYTVPSNVPKDVAARQHLLASLKTAALTLNSQVFRMETTGHIDDRSIEKWYERLAWAVDGFREEQELAKLDAADNSEVPDSERAAVALETPCDLVRDMARMLLERFVDEHLRREMLGCSPEYRLGVVDLVCRRAAGEEIPERFDPGTAKGDTYQLGVEHAYLMLERLASRGTDGSPWAAGKRGAR